MDLQLRQWIIHELIKTPDEGEAHIFLSEQTQEVDEQSELLVKRLHQILLKKNEVTTGQLASPQDALFPGHFRMWQETNYQEAGFIDFSRDSMQALQLSLQGVVGAKGGFLVYAHYTVDGQASLGIFLVRNKQGVVFERHQGQAAFRVEPQTYLDVDRLAMACNITIRDGVEHMPVQVIKHARSQKDISDYFLNWLALEEVTNNREATQQFLSALDAIPLPIAEETGEAVPAADFREQVVQFAERSPSKTINLKAFEEKFYGEEQPLQEFFSEQGHDPLADFRVDQQALREYHFHKFKGNGFYFGTKHAHILSGKVRVEGNQVIIDDEGLAAEILAFLQ